MKNACAGSFLARSLSASIQMMTKKRETMTKLMTEIHFGQASPSGRALSLSDHGSHKPRSQIQPQSLQSPWPAAITNTPRGPGNSG
ncbi:hypothetical protein NL676_013555 [Syzygium grande]|nr:hypothetical protein NL676_013555 [Syzygium grande]